MGGKRSVLNQDSQTLVHLILFQRLIEYNSDLNI